MIVLKHVDKAYSDRIVFRDYSLCLSDGESYALTAPSGHGKTTLLRLIAGLEQPDAGVLRVDGRISAVFQEDRLLDYLDAVRNVRFACPKADVETVRSLLMAMGLKEDELANPVVAFSGGMRRRVAIARALLYPADILLMDEPYKGLDDDTRARVIACAKPYMTGKTVIITSHDPRDWEGLKRICLE